MNIPNEVIIHQLVSLRAQIDAMLTLITDESQSGGTSGNCNHPRSKRLVLTTLGGPEHWVCKDCDYEFREDEE
jgi:hypothetical protein